MIVEILISLGMTLGYYFWYLSKKKNTIKTVGICNKVYGSSGGCRGAFEYQIDNIKYYNVESSSHIGWLKEGKKYNIYVKKDNHEIFISNRVLGDMKFFIILMGSISVILIFLVIWEALL